jgi:hypothetical protein
VFSGVRSLDAGVLKKTSDYYCLTFAVVLPSGGDSPWYSYGGNYGYVDVSHPPSTSNRTACTTTIASLTTRKNQTVEAMNKMTLISKPTFHYPHGHVVSSCFTRLAMSSADDVCPPTPEYTTTAVLANTEATPDHFSSSPLTSWSPTLSYISPFLLHLWRPVESRKSSRERKWHTWTNLQRL